MNRRRLLWLGLPLIVLGVVVAAWFWLSQRDTDFVVVRPKTIGLRDTLAALDSTIDAGDFHQCETVQQALRTLTDRFSPEINFVHIDRKALRDEFGFKRDLNLAIVRYESKPHPMTVKEFLRLTFAQTDVSNVNFAVNSGYLVVTSPTAATKERADYVEGLSVYDRLHGFWKELTGNLDADPPRYLSGRIYSFPISREKSP